MLRKALQGIKKCAGKRPWLPGARDESCEKPLRVLQRGSSNVWFGALRSSISIPPWSSPNAQFVTKHWDVLKELPSNLIEQTLPAILSGSPLPGTSVDGVIDVLRQRQGLQANAEPTDAELRDEEYRALIDGHEGGPLDTFQCLTVDVASELRPFVTQVSQASRLREVRALQGFARVTPVATDTTNPSLARLSAAHHSWLPAVEVLGEGIFIRFTENFLKDWERDVFAVGRHAILAASLGRRATESGAPAPEAPAVRFIALHTLAHAILQELSLDAGYPVSSLRERVYGEANQSGILIYTASSDAAGSLGGLAALADERRFADSLGNAISRAGWCTNDPVCSESGPSGSDGLNLAACHACLLLPETSCEHRNIYLDRLMLIGTSSDPTLGLVSEVC